MKTQPHSTSLLKPSTMAKFMLVTLFLLFSFASFPAPGKAISYCNEACKTMNDCDGQLICINGKCDDDPDVGTHICDGTSPPPPPPAPGNGSSYCNGPCQTLNDCSGQLICINGKCDDDPDVGTHICKGSPPPGRGCEPLATMTCKGKSYPIYDCSPPVLTSMTPALLMNKNFSEGGGGGGPSECDGNYHSNDELIVALSTGWYNGASRCGDTIQITATSNGRSAKAKVVGECDSRNGCDPEHDWQPPCGNNVVSGSDAVWRALGLNEDLAAGAAAVNITWSEVTNFFQIICFYE